MPPRAAARRHPPPAPRAPPGAPKRHSLAPPGSCRSTGRGSRPTSIAGATLAALAIPEVMGYTKIAGTPVITGLYTLVLPILALRPARLVAPPRRRRRLRDGGDPGDRPARDRVPSPDHPQYVGARVAGRADVRGPAASSRVCSSSGSSPTSCRGACSSASSPASGSRSRWASSAGCSGSARRAARTLQKFVDDAPGDPDRRRACRRSSCRWRSSASIVGLERVNKEIPGRSSRSWERSSLSYVLDLAARGITTLGPVPGGLPSLSLPTDSDHRRQHRGAAPDGHLDVRRHPRPERGDVACVCA